MRRVGCSVRVTQDLLTRSKRGDEIEGLCLVTLTPRFMIALVACGWMGFTRQGDSLRGAVCEAARQLTMFTKSLCTNDFRGSLHALRCLQICLKREFFSKHRQNFLCVVDQKYCALKKK
jgi:hypothetical protein